MSSITVALVDDHELVREGLVAWLAARSTDNVVLAATATVEDLLAGHDKWADVVLLDLNLGDETQAGAGQGSQRAEHRVVQLSLLCASVRPAHRGRPVDDECAAQSCVRIVVVRGGATGEPTADRGGNQDRQVDDDEDSDIGYVERPGRGHGGELGADQLVG